MNYAINRNKIFGDDVIPELSHCEDQISLTVHVRNLTSHQWKQSNSVTEEVQAFRKTSYAAETHIARID